MRIAPADSHVLTNVRSAAATKESPDFRARRALDSWPSYTPNAHLRMMAAIARSPRIDTFLRASIASGVQDRRSSDVFPSPTRIRDNASRIEIESDVPPRLQAAQDAVKARLERFLQASDPTPPRSEALANLGEALWQLEETSRSYSYEALSIVAMELRLVLFNTPVNQLVSQKLETFRQVAVESISTSPDSLDASGCSQALRRGGLNWIPPLEQFGEQNAAQLAGCNVRITIEPVDDEADKDVFSLDAGIARLNGRTPDEILTARNRMLSEASEPLPFPAGKTFAEVIMGQWPGDESDDEIAAALRALS